MALLIGTDEAGYGPNLGPLVIAGTAWRVPDELRDAELYQVLEPLVGRDDDGDGRLVIADSKRLYRPGGGLAALERGVLAMSELVHGPLCSWRAAWQALAPESLSDVDALPWYREFDGALPLACDRGTLEAISAVLRPALAGYGIALVQQRAVAIFPGRFNTLVQTLGSKGAALSQSTLALIRQLLDDLDDAATTVQCDKHGGRNRYGPLLQQEFGEYLVEVVLENRRSSVYRWGPPRRRVEFRFVARGEQFLPTALASMTAKYLRELAMQAFNAFWQQRLPDIRPTAGYPIDARRFRQQIQPLQTELGIPDVVLWRNR